MQRAWEADPFWKDVGDLLGGERKLRGDSYLESLSASDLDTLRCALSLRTLRESTAAAPLWPCGEDAGQPPSINTIAKIAEAARQVQVLRNLQRDKLLNDAVKAKAKELGLQFSEEEIDELCSMVLHRVKSEANQGLAIDGKALGALLKRSDQKLDRDKFEFLRTRAEQADKAQKVAESPLTPEEKMQQMRGIFGMT